MEDVQFIADSLGKKMSRINVTRQTDLDQLEVVCCLWLVADYTSELWS